MIREQLDIEGDAWVRRYVPAASAPAVSAKDYWAASSFHDLPQLAFDLLMVDPPWQFDNWSDKGKGKSADAHYRCLPDDVIKALPIGNIAARDAIMFLWATSPRVEFAYACARHWGFRPVTLGFWRKTTINGNTAFGTGYRARNAGDPWIIAVAGHPDTSKAERNYFSGLAREHSRKPEAGFEWCERYLPAARRIEVFSRSNRPGWTCWGDEAGKFPDTKAP